MVVLPLGLDSGVIVSVWAGVLELLSCTLPLRSLDVTSATGVASGRCSGSGDDDGDDAAFVWSSLTVVGIPLWRMGGGR